jgi:endonuclease-3
MPTTINKQRVLSQLLAACEPSPDRAEEPRSVLEQFVYGLCRENATAEQADQAFANLRQRFFDWNEVRVSSTKELEEAFAGLSGAEGRAQRLLSFLQEVFETTFAFELDKLQKTPLKQAAKQLGRYQAADDYIGAWVMQRSLGGHALPIDGPTLRCARRLGLLDVEAEDLEAARSSLEHLVPKSKGPLFTDAISTLAERHCWEGEPDCPGCPLQGDCVSAQELLGGGLAVAQGVPRLKPR